MAKMSVSLIVAVANNGVIGNKNEIPWKLKGDMAFFREKTTDHTVIMGRKTWESLPPNFRPLPNRKNIVITRNPNYQLPPSVLRAGDIREALVMAEKSYADINQPVETFVIGGGEIYNQAIVYADTIYMTEVKTALEGDAYFHLEHANNWTVVNREYGHANDHNQFDFTIKTMKRKGLARDWNILESPGGIGNVPEPPKEIKPEPTPVVEPEAATYPIADVYEATLEFRIDGDLESILARRLGRITTIDLETRGISQDFQRNHFTSYIAKNALTCLHKLLQVNPDVLWRVTIEVHAQSDTEAPTWYLLGLSKQR